MILLNYIYPYTSEQYIWFSDNTFSQFMMGIYMGYFMQTDGEIVPRVVHEFLYATLLLLLGQIFFSYVMGEIANQQAEMGKEDYELQRKIDLTNSAMKNLQVDRALWRDVSIYVMNTHATQKKQIELTSFLDSISPSIRVKCTSLIFMKLVRENVILKTISQTMTRNAMIAAKGKLKNDNSDHLQKIVAKMEVQLSMPEDVIVG